MSGGTWAVVVARTGPTAKSRLAPPFSPLERSELALAMLEDVLTACAGAPLGGVVAVVDSTAGRVAAAARGALVVDEPRSRPAASPDGGMNAAVAAGIAAALSRGAAAALVLPGDVPLVTAEDLAEVAAAASDTPRGVVVVTDRFGTGTNALLLRPPTVIPPAFGPESAVRHLAAAAAVGATTRRLQLPALALDVDTRADLEELLRRRPVGATAAVLERLTVRIGV